MSPPVQPPDPAEAQSKRRPILELFALLTVMAIGGFGYSLLQLWQAAEREALDSLYYINQQLAQSTRATFIKHETILRVVGEELLRVGILEEPESGRALIEDIGKTDPGMVGFGFIRPDGQLLLASGIPPERPLPNLMALGRFHFISVRSHSCTCRVIYKHRDHSVIQSIRFPVLIARSSRPRARVAQRRMLRR